MLMATSVSAAAKLTCNIVNQFANTADVLVTDGPPGSGGLRISVDRFGVLTSRPIENYVI